MSDIVVSGAPNAVAAFTHDQMVMVRDTFANGASDQEFAVLMEVARSRNLNPLLRQIHFVKRWDRAKGREVWSTQVSIDGMRAIAQRTGLYDGQDEPEYQDSADGMPVLSRVRVYRKDWTRPAVGVAYFSEYAQRSKDGSLTQFWSKMPRVMIAKCAEAIALRKAFPEDTSGLYVPEEMAQADNDAHVERATIVSPDAPAAAAAPKRGRRKAADEAPAQQSADVEVALRATEMLQRIQAAESTTILTDIAREAKEADFPEEFRKPMLEAWRARHAQLSDPEAT